jgi:gliding motility-associated protein GldM
MAGGKVSARQKMINLMYLVFIAMMAMNMSKEVLRSFGLMEAKFAESNTIASDSNSKLLEDLVAKGEEKPKEFAFAASKAEQVSLSSDKFDKFIESQKIELLKRGKYSVDPESGELPFSQMDKTSILEEYWFTGDRLTKDGDAFMAAIETYKEEIKSILGNDVKYKKAISVFEKRFNTAKVTDSEGVKKSYLAYYYKGYPAIASYTKLTSVQNDVKVTEASLYNLFLGNTLTDAVTLKNYKAIVLADKSAFFAGEKFQGRVVLGKYANVVPTKLSVQGQEVDLSKAIDSTGAARLDFNVGNVGEREINGSFTFLEDGKPLEIPITGNYVVVPRPNDASIGADKMNVIYRGLKNPLSISFAGVPDNKVTVSASGGAKIKKTSNGKYSITPSTGKVTNISASAILADGDKVISTKEFRIKSIPNPNGKISGKSGSIRLNKNSVLTSKVLADFGDFVYDLKPSVYSFDLTISGQTPITVSGSNRLNANAKNAVKKAPKRSTITIDNIKVRVQGVSARIPEASPIIIQLTN